MIGKFNRFVQNPNPYFGVLYYKYIYYRSNLLSKIAPYSWIDDKYWLEYHFYKRYKHRLDLRNPQTISEKIQWMKLYYRIPLYTQLADKFLVRNYVKEKIGLNYLIPIIGVYDKFEQINWDLLPERFVIKMNHGCGWNIICNDKTKFDHKDAFEKISEWSRINFYTRYREWQYKHINPKIIVEQYLEGDPNYGLIDFKIFCFNGHPKYVEVFTDRYKDIHLDIYDLNWIKQPFTYVGYPNSEHPIAKPGNFDEMLFIASKLSENLPFCKADLYSFNNKIYFGELTLSPGAGFNIFTPPEYNLKLGKLFDLPKKKISKI